MLPAVHWLERNDLLAFTSSLHDEPFVQYGVRAVEPPPDVREEWRIFTDLAIAMRRPLFRARGLNTFITATRALARMTRRPGLGVHPALDRPAARGDLTKSQRTQAEMARSAGTSARFGAGTARVRSVPPRAAHRGRKRVHAAPPEFVGRACELLAGPHPAAPERYPFQLG